jgi:Ti-type conjugative transfer relaxase TraA
MFHLRVKIIGRSGGARSAAAAFAYRAGTRGGAAALAYRAGVKLRCPVTGRTFDYSKKAMIDSEGFGILHTETLLPQGAPAWMADRQLLINAIEAKEKRDDAQLMREVEISLPRELTFEQQRELLHAFVRAMFVARGMVADVSMHDERASDGGRNPHAHVLLTMRHVTAEGFGNKNRDWNPTALVREWRNAWAEMANEALAKYGHERRLDARSHRERGIDLEPDSYVGPSTNTGFEGVISADRRESRKAAKQENTKRITADPAKLLDAITREKATFTDADITGAIRRATALEPGDPEFLDLMQRVLASRDLVTIASDTRGAKRYATRAMIKCEIDMMKAARSLAARSTFNLDPKVPASLFIEQKHAFLHATLGSDFVAISGVAGAGKTTALAAIAAAHQQAGHRVVGAAVAGIAVRKLSEEAGIPARTLASAFSCWDHKDARGLPDPIAPLKRGDVLILDEAGMVCSRDMRRVLTEAECVGAKVILVGDAQQLQAIEAGAAFRALVEMHGAAKLQDVRRQTVEWQRTASVLLSEHRASEALALYREAGAVHGAANTGQAMDALVASYLSHRDEPGSQAILTYYTADVRTLNDKVREGLRAAGQLGPDMAVKFKEQVRDDNGELIGEKTTKSVLAKGDRLLFTKNDKALDVQNGLTGRVLDLSEEGRMRVSLDGGRTVDFSLQDYAYLSLGYATTVHKAQGATYDRAFVLATNRMDARLAYVALTRHRQSVDLFYGRDQFQKEGDLERAFARQQVKDTTLDYLDGYLDAYAARERTEGQARGDVSRKRADAPRPEPKPSWAVGPVYVAPRSKPEKEKAVAPVAQRSVAPTPLAAEQRHETKAPASATKKSEPPKPTPALDEPKLPEPVTREFEPAKALPLSPLDHIRRNAARRQQALVRDAQRERGYGD